MAASTVAYTDTTGNKDYLGMIASQIGKRLKQASDMASDERAFAESQAEKNNTSLAEAGIGRGHFFGRALGSRFGGDRIARTRGRLGAQGPGTNPTKNYKQRFRGGFDYNYSEQINQVTRDVGGAIVPMSSALSVGLRGVESGLVQVSQSIASIGSSMGELAVAQKDLARQAMMNGAFMRAFMTYMQRQQSRAGARREERLLEGGRRRLGGGRGPINITPGRGGGGAGLKNQFGLSGLDALNFGSGQALRQASKAGATTPKALKAAQTGFRGGVSNVFSAPKTIAQNASKFMPDVGKISQNVAKFFKLQPRQVKKAIVPKAAKSTATAARTSLKGGQAALGMGALINDPEFMAGMVGGGPATQALQKEMMELAALGDEQKILEKFAEFGGEISADGVTVTVRSTPLGESAALAKNVSPQDAAKLAPYRMAAADDAGLKVADMVSDQLIRKGTKEGLKRGGALTRAMVKQFGAAGTRSILKKIPIVAGLAGVAFGIQRALEGDFLGAGLEITSGLLGATGVGGGLGLGIDGFLLARDIGMMPMAKGGLLTGRRPVNALMGEAGPEIVTPLNEETFEKFGKGILDAQKRNKSDFIALHKAPVEKAIDGTLAKKSWWDSLKGFFGGGNGGDNPQGGFNLFNPSTWFGGGSTQSQTPMLTPPPPVTTGVTGSTAERNLAAFLSTLEATGDQNSMDALQVMLNRTALSKSGKGYTWAGNSLFEQITAREQFSPYSAAIFGTSADPAAAAKYGNILSGSPEERRMKLMEIASGPDALNNLQTLFKGGNAASASRILADLQSDGALAKESRRYIQGRTSFRGYRSGSGDLNRGRGGNFFFNNQGTTGLIDNISPLSNLQSLNASGDQANALNRNSMFTGMLGGGMMMPTTVINNYTAAAPATGSGDSSFGAAFESSGFSPFVNFYSLAAKS